jgi:hypothetical protein
MHNSLLARVHVVELNAEFGAVGAQRGNLFGRDLVDNIQPAFNGRRHIVVDGRDGAVGAANLATGQPQAFKCLRRSDLVHELQVDVEQRGLALRLDNYMPLPYFFEQRFWFGTHLNTAPGH